VGTLSFTYVGRNLYSFVDFLVFLAAAGLGWVLVRRPGRGRAAAAVLLLLVPLCLAWFASGASVEVFTSLLAGGAAAFVLLGALRLRMALAERRAARFSLPPDPYLEDAARPEKKEAEPAAAAAPAPAAAPPAESPRATHGSNDPAKGN